MAFILCLISAIFYVGHYQTASVQRNVLNNIKYLEPYSFTYFIYPQGEELVIMDISYKVNVSYKNSTF